MEDVCDQKLKKELRQQWSSQQKFFFLLFVLHVLLMFWFIDDISIIYNGTSTYEIHWFWNLFHNLKI